MSSMILALQYYMYTIGNIIFKNTFCSCLALVASSALRLSSNQTSWYLCPRRL